MPQAAVSDYPLARADGHSAGSPKRRVRDSSRYGGPSASDRRVGRRSNEEDLHAVLRVEDLAFPGPAIGLVDWQEPDCKVPTSVRDVTERRLASDLAQRLREP